jgi:hypothetical protein
MKEKQKQEEQHQEEKKSLVDLFTKDELKSFFLRYLVIIGCLEIFIFIVSFFSVLEPYASPFPWREYFYAAFTIPIGITFLLGIVIIAFNTYYFKGISHFNGLKSSFDMEEAEKPLSKSKMFLNLSWQFQFLLFLLALGLCALVMFHLDDILAMTANAGEKAFNAILIFTGILLTGAVILGILYLYFHYKLRKSHIDFAHQYKWELMNKSGMLLLDDNTVINSEGKVINKPTGPNGSSANVKTLSGDDVSLLPNLNNRDS